MRVLIIIISFCFLCLGLYAQEGGKPELNSHEFIPVSDSRGPFTNSRISMQVGIGQTTDFKFQPIILDDDTLGGFDGEILFISLGLHFQQRIREWISVFGSTISKEGRGFERVTKQQWKAPSLWGNEFLFGTILQFVPAMCT